MQKQVNKNCVYSKRPLPTCIIKLLLKKRHLWHAMKRSKLSKCMLDKIIMILIINADYNYVKCMIVCDADI